MGAAKKSKGGVKKRGRSSLRGATKEARERAARFAPNPNLALIAGDALKAQIVAVALHRLYAPSDFARETGVPLNVASYAFKVLHERGVLELVKEEKVKGATIKHLYRATQAALVSDAEWSDLAEAIRPVFTGAILHDFSARVEEAIKTGHLYSRDDFCLYWTPRDLDEIAWREQVKIVNWAIEESARLEADTVNRRVNGESSGSFCSTFAVAAFPSPTHAEATKRQSRQGKSKSRRKGKSKRAKPTSKRDKQT